jgi:hypothetical protein
MESFCGVELAGHALTALFKRRSIPERCSDGGARERPLV